MALCAIPDLIIRPPVVVVEQLGEERLAMTHFTMVALYQDRFVALVYPVSQLILDVIAEPLFVSDWFPAPGTNEVFPYSWSYCCMAGKQCPSLGCDQFALARCKD
jgi:hypothetical protein